jgi:Ca2+ transporting ATPase
MDAPKKLSQQTQKRLCDAICFNTEANPKRSKIHGKFEQLGNKTECALIQLADQFGVNYEPYRNKEKLLKVIPFNSSRKKMLTAAYHDGKIVVYVKGASEVILNNCTRYITENG